jgi:hypothetical protein
MKAEVVDPDLWVKEETNKHMDSLTSSMDNQAHPVLSI